MRQATSCFSRAAHRLPIYEACIEPSCEISGVRGAISLQYRRSLRLSFSRYRSWKATIVPQHLRCPPTLISMLSCAHCYDEGNVERQQLPGFGELNPMFRRAVSMYRRASEGRDPDDLTKDQIVRFLEDDLGLRQGLNFIGALEPADVVQGDPGLIAGDR